MLKKSSFFDFLNRRKDIDIEQYLLNLIEDGDCIDWNGFLLPNDYGDPELEYHAIRNSCAIFDVSPLRKYRIQGADAGTFLDRLVTRPASTTQSMRGVYVVFCNQDGSLKDDAILHKYADDDYMLLPSDMDHSEYFDGLRQQLGINNISIIDCTESWIGLAVQGPNSAAVLQQMGIKNIEQLEPLQICDYPFSNGVIRIARMGFTADLGYELWLEPERRVMLEQSIQSVRESMGIVIPGYGLTALQACRLEGGFIVAGWDCATEADPEPGFERSPFELGLGWLVDLDAADFVGRDAMLEQRRSGYTYTLRSFELDVPRQLEDGVALYASIDGHDVSIGLITCSSWSWGMDRMIGNASIECRYVDNEEVWAIVDGDALKVSLSRGPLRKFERSKLVPAPIDL